LFLKNKKNERRDPKMEEIQKIEDKMSKDLKSWGIGLLIMGFLHQIIPFLSPEWGKVLIIIGVLVNLIRHRAMYILLGLSLIVVGFLNFLGGLQVNSSFWPIFGCLQVYWGLKEMEKFKKYEKETNNDVISAKEKQLTKAQK